jgi:hypothetical protein
VSDPNDCAEIFAFVEIDEAGEVGLVRVWDTNGAPVPLVCGRRANAALMVADAREHARLSGNRVELRHFPGPYRLVEVYGRHNEEDPS